MGFKKPCDSPVIGLHGALEEPEAPLEKCANGVTTAQ